MSITSPGRFRPEALAIMRRIDALHLVYPFAGSRMLRDMLGREGVEIGRLRVSAMMKRIGYRSSVSPAEYVKARGGTQDRSILIYCAG